MDMNKYLEVVKICKEYYPSTIYEHAKKVEEYVILDSRYALLSVEEQWLIRAVALAHDLLEDTNCTKDILKETDKNFSIYVDELTHKKNISYYNYVKNIIESNHYISIIVKTADIKDHLMRKKTLTPRLKEKYAKVIPLFLNKQE